MSGRRGRLPISGSQPGWTGRAAQQFVQKLDDLLGAKGLAQRGGGPELLPRAAHLRQAHTRIVVPALTIPNSTRGFTQLWTRIQQAKRSTGCREVVCGLEPTGTYHQAVATFLAAQGADVVLLSSSVAYWNRRTQDGTWDKHDRKDAANCADLLEQGKVLFYSQPDGPLAELRHLVRLLRRARGELASCKARWRTTLRPALAPMGEPLPQRLWVELPPVLQAWERAAPGRPAVPKGRLPLGLATACADLGAQVTAVQARVAALEAALTPLAARRPAYPLLRSIPGVGATVATILLAEIGDIGWYTQFSQLRKLAGLDIVRLQSGQFAGQARISKSGRSLLRWALYHAAIGVARTVAGRARLAALKAKRHGDRYAAFKAIVELAASNSGSCGACGGAGCRMTPPGPAGSGGNPAEDCPSTASPGSWQRDIPTWRPHLGTARGPWRAAPTLSSPDRAGWIPHGSAAIG